MFKKNDPLVQSVQKVMEENERRRQVEAKLCEELGIYSRKELPHEHQKNYDALLEQRINEGLHPNQQKLDVHEPEKDKLTAQDFKMLRAKKKTMEEEDKKEKPISKKIDKEKEAYSKMRQELVGKGTDRKTTEKLVSEEEGDETREGGAVVDTKTNKSVVSSTASRAEGPSPAERAALTNKIKQMKEAMLSGPETGPRKTPGSNQMNEEQIEEKKLTDAEISKREKIVKSMKKGAGAAGFESRYGKRAKEVMYATATKQAKKLAEEKITLDSVMEEIKKKLGRKKMEEIDEQEDDGEGRSPTNPLRGSRYDTGSEGETPKSSTSGTQTPTSTSQAQPADQPSSVERRLAGARQAKPYRPEPEERSQERQLTIPASNVQEPPKTTEKKISAQMKPNERVPVQSFGDEPRRADADNILASKPPPAAPAPAPAARQPAAAPAARQPAARPQIAATKTAPVAPRPTAPEPPTSPGEESAASFFAADRARQEAGKISGPYNPTNRSAARSMPRPAARPVRAGARPIRESLETTIRNILKD